jgi:hypothetical protein
MVIDTEFDDFVPPPMPRELADMVTFACGQAEGSQHDYHFVMYVELNAQTRIGPLREWVCSAPPMPPEDLDEGEEMQPLKRWCTRFTSRPAYLKDRETHIKRHTDQSLRCIPGDELIARAAWTVGSKDRGGQGARNDMEDIREILREKGPQEGIRAVAEKYPGHFMRYPSGITQLADLVAPRVDEDPDFTLRPWQECMVEILRGPAHDRHIYWIEDAKGGEGKSRLATYLCRTMNAVELDGRFTDAAFAYASQPIVLFDLARAVDLLQLKDLYTMAEKLKNGQLVSAKYQSKLKVFKAPHVVFFSNVPPPIGVWSADRVQHILLNSAPPFQVHSKAGAPVLPPEPTGASLFEKLLAKKRAEAEEAAQRAAEAAEDAEEREVAKAAMRPRLKRSHADSEEDS